MVEYQFVIIAVLISYLIPLAKAEEQIQEEWNELCPKMCTCHLTHFSQLPFTSLIHTNIKKYQPGLKKEKQPSYKEQNEALYEEDERLYNFENDPILKMAVCIVYEGAVLKDVLTTLEKIEALTLLQSSTKENITLRSEEFNGFKNLQILEIHGIDDKYKQGNLYLKYDALKQLKSLEYINLQNIRLVGSPKQGNKILPISPYDYTNTNTDTNQISIIQPNYEQKVRRIGSKKNLKPLVQHLVFLSPNEVEAEIVPYEVYKEEQQQLGVYSFGGLRNLKFLRVFSCNLTEINWEMFDGLENLETLSLEGNNLLFLPEFAFYGTPNLKSLSLASNKLLNIQSMSLAGLLQLENLDVSYNNISHLSELSLPPLPKLILADFRNNPLEIIFPSTFEIMNATQQLHLGTSGIILDLQPNTFSGLHSLLKLHLNNINQDILEREIFKGMPELRQLEITGHIRAIAFDAFIDMPKLENLILKNCSIEKLSMDSFYGLYELRLLDLSYNLLRTLPPGLFDQQFSIKELYLNNNNLKTLPGGFFSNVPAKLIRLDKNPWHCTCEMKDWKPSVINQIKQISKDNGMCQFRFDKGSMCSLSDGVEYVYNKRVEPRCETPIKFKGWSVFHLLRKQLHCDKKKKYMKINRKAYLAQKLSDYEKMKESNKFMYNPIKRYTVNKTETHQENTIGEDKPVKNVTESEIKTTPTEPSNAEQITNKIINEIKSDDNNLINKNSEPNINIIKQIPTKEINELQNDFKRIHFQEKEQKQIHFQEKEQKLSKKEKEKLQMLKEKEERLRMKEKIKKSENMDSIKLKQIWKTELENKKKEKLKLLSTSNL